MRPLALSPAVLDTPAFHPDRADDWVREAASLDCHGVIRRLLGPLDDLELPLLALTTAVRHDAPGTVDAVQDWLRRHPPAVARGFARAVQGGGARCVGPLLAPGTPMAGFAREMWSGGTSLVVDAAVCSGRLDALRQLRGLMGPCVPEAALRWAVWSALRNRPAVLAELHRAWGATAADLCQVLVGLGRPPRRVRAVLYGAPWFID